MPIKCLGKVKHCVSARCCGKPGVTAVPKVLSDGWEIKLKPPLQLLINDSVAFFMTEIFPGN